MKTTRQGNNLFFVSLLFPPCDRRCCLFQTLFNLAISNKAVLVFLSIFFYLWICKHKTSHFLLFVSDLSKLRAGSAPKSRTTQSSKLSTNNMRLTVYNHIMSFTFIIIDACINNHVYICFRSILFVLKQFSWFTML